ncbi:MAG: hypothetical protein ACRCWM_06800 [Sarcina sp.]
MNFKTNFSNLKDKVSFKASEISKDLKEVDWKDKGNVILTSVKNFDYEKAQKNIKKSILDISRSANNLIKYIKTKYKKEDAVQLMKELDRTTISKFKDLKEGLDARRKTKVITDNQYLLETAIIHEEREKMLELFVEQTGEMEFEFDNLKFIKKYQESISQKGFRQLKNAEGIYIALLDHQYLLDDYSAVYIMYTKFLEIEMSAKIKYEGRTTNFSNLLKRVNNDYEWKFFVEGFNHLQIREKRNLAAHGGDVSISFEDVEDIRKFILRDEVINTIASRNSCLRS